MKLKADTYYRTRNGRVAYVAGLCPAPDKIEPEFAALGYVWNSKLRRWEDTAWTTEGVYRPGSEEFLDLVIETHGAPL